MDLKKLQDKASDMPDHEKMAKMQVLHHMKKVAEDMMKSHMDGGAKKVSVMSNSPEGLQHGLAKAQELVSHGESPEGDPLAGEETDEMVHGDVNEPGESTHDPKSFSVPDGSDSDSPDMGEPDEDDMSHDAIDAKIKHLMDLKKKKLK